jgi:hypothetical protein
MEPAIRIERATCGLRIARRPTPTQQINHLALQNTARHGKWSAIPQPGATRILTAHSLRQTTRYPTRSANHDAVSCVPFRLQHQRLVSAMASSCAALPSLWESGKPLAEGLPETGPAGGIAGDAKGIRSHAVCTETKGR